MVVKLPLYSLRAWGKFYGPYPHGSFYPEPWRNVGYCIYRRRSTGGRIVTDKIVYTITFNPRTEAQQANRASFSSAVKAWQNLTEFEKEIYNDYTYPYQMSGYNRFLHYYMLGNYS